MNAWGEVVARFLRLIEPLVAQMQKKKRRQAEEKRQADRDAFERDPAEWFADHFSGGVQRTPPNSESTPQTDAANADDHKQS